MSAAHHLQRALECHRAGRLDEAAALYRLILQSEPHHPDASYLLGTIAYQRGDCAEAVRLIRLSLAVRPQPAGVHLHLGLALLRLGSLDEAADSFRQAAEQDPSLAPAHNNFGTVRHLQGRSDEAAAAYRQAVAADPRFADAHHNLGKVLRARGDLAGAAESLRRAADLLPASADVAAALAEVLCALGRASEALPLYQQALPAFPQDATLWCGHGHVLQVLGRLPEALEAYRRAVALAEALEPAWWGMGCTHLAREEYAAAVAALRRAVALAPGRADAHRNLGKALFELGQVDPALDALRRAAALEQPGAEAVGAIATMIPGSPAADNRAILEARAEWAALCAPVGPGKACPGLTRAADRRLRVGYVSAFFPRRNWMKPVWGLINHHDRERFEVHLFSDAPEEQVRHGYRKDPHDRFHDVSALDNAALARLIEGEGIDVLVDLNGYSAPRRLPLFALRPAPVIVAWFNMFATSGMSAFDYLIGDEHVIPAGEEAFYREAIVRVPGCYLTFEVGYPVPDVAPAPCLSRGAVTFGCLAPQYKITTEVVEAWARILRESPRSTLVLQNTALGKADNRSFVQGLFERCGVSAERLRLNGPAEHYTFLERYAEIDLALDTFPYNGGTTTMEALWQGVPVLAFAGDRWAARISASLLHNAGLPEFVRPDPEGYVATAVELAAKPEALAELRGGLRERLRRSSACDVARFARDMEREYLRASSA
jgi:predicted O-linked N-acetylglucosamine transferase (SPINDLY family)